MARYFLRCSVVESLAFQMLSNFQKDKETEQFKELLDGYKKVYHYDHPNFQAIMNTKTREYLPGFGRLRFMSYLKSLIDPSFFRVEEQQIRAMSMRFARKLVEEDSRSDQHTLETLHQFYNTVDNIFKYYKDIKSNILYFVLVI